MYDFEHFRAIIEGEADDWVPPAELGIDQEVKEAFLGRPVSHAADEIAFWQQAGYAYALQRVWPGFVEPYDLVKTGIMATRQHSYTVYTDRQAVRTWAPEGTGALASWDDFEQFPWPSADTGHYRQFHELSELLPPGMKLIAVEGRIFQITWMLMGYETFCIKLAEDPEFVKAVLDKIAALRLEGFYRVIEMPAVGMGWLPDDIAYTEGLMAAPKFLRETLFPWYRRFSDAAHAAGKPIGYHSDGRLWEVFEDLIEYCRFDAVHPIEPKAMDAREAKQRVAGRVCLIGNVELDRLARGTPEEVHMMVRDRIEAIGFGGYCVGSSNSVTHYVPIDNYRALLEASRQYGRV